MTKPLQPKARRWRAAWRAEGFLTSGHHWPAASAAADLSWAASGHRWGSGWSARPRRYTHTASRARPESTTGRRRQEEFINNCPHWTLDMNLHLSRNHLSPCWCSREKVFTCNHCRITQRCLSEAKTCPTESLWRSTKPQNEKGREVQPWATGQSTYASSLVLLSCIQS